MSGLGPGAVTVILNPAASTERYARKQERWRYAIGVFLAFLYFSFVALSIANLVPAWQTGSPEDWQTFWHTPLDVLRLLPFLVLLRPDLLDSIFRPLIRAAAVRQAAIAGDDAQAPCAAQQPPQLTTSALHDGDTEISDLMCLMYRVNIYPVNQQDGQEFSIILNESGARWRNPRIGNREQHILWSEAQAFVTVRLLNVRTHSVRLSRVVYALITPHAVLSWEITRRATMKQWAASRVLAGLIVARTGLPLRNLTPALNAAVNPPAAPVKPQICFPLGKLGTPDAVPGIPPAPTAAFVESDSYSSRQLFRFRSLVAVAAVLILLIYGTGFVLQHLQPR